MKPHCIEGIVLKTIRYQDHDLIFTVFSEKEGVCRFFGKGFGNPKRSKGILIDPLTHAEFIYTETKGELYRCQEITLINAQLNLRNSYATIQAAQKMAHALDTSQYLQKPAPLLYQLFLRYLTAVPNCKNPEVLTASFYLKILRHEGLVNQEQAPFTNPLWKTLAFSQSINELIHLEISQLMIQEVANYFDRAIFVEAGN